MRGKQKLAKDLEILEAMAAGMNNYLLSKTMFQTLQTGMPQLTLGGYLMRQHRLLALTDELLNEMEQGRLEKAVDQFKQSLMGKQAQFEQKVEREIGSRLRQWAEYLREVEGDPAENAPYYTSRVEVRAMVAALIEALPAPAAAPTDALDQLDDKLSQTWQPGHFVWPTEWQPAYPKDLFWWLYGNPRF
jgi:hypothetical protein